MTTAVQPPLPERPFLRLRLAPHGGLPRAIDGAWWPHSDDLLTELPQLLAGLPSAWGHISSVTVNSAAWSALPGRILVVNQVVRLTTTATTSDPHTIVLVAPGEGRWDLLVVPPGATEDAAEPLMSAAAGLFR
ncbi:DUF5994 family protein [Streptomyces sp. NPDC048643]|uniref:DUF5994 family protein n=1 Tax=Streptomyces sp. NPDC048643 TaxID=3155637 RepID=UPI00341ABB0C